MGVGGTVKGGGNEWACGVTGRGGNRLIEVKFMAERNLMRVPKEQLLFNKYLKTPPIYDLKLNNQPLLFITTTPI